ncbi:MAG: hypothetical protein ACXVQY_13335 [Actinomycetota bacterium]
MTFLLIAHPIVWPVGFADQGRWSPPKRAVRALGRNRLHGRRSKVFVKRLLSVCAVVLMLGLLPARADFYGSGLHSWPYWQDDLHWALPQIMASMS